MEAEEVIPQPQYSPFQNPMTRLEGAIVTLTSSDSELYKLELVLRNATVDDDGNIKVRGEPLMNDYGINSIMGTIQSIVNRITFLSNIEMSEVQMLTEYMADTIAKDLMINRVRYGIKDFATRTRIYQMVITSAYLALKRAYKEGDKRFLRGSVQEIHTTVGTDKKKAPSLFPFAK